MKKITILLLFFFISSAKAQEVKSSNTSTVNSLKWTVGDKDKLNKIKWEKVKKMFEANSKSDTISLAFEVNDYKKRKKLKTKYSLEVKGISENIDGLIDISKKTIKVLNKIKTK